MDLLLKRKNLKRHVSVSKPLDHCDFEVETLRNNNSLSDVSMSVSPNCGDSPVIVIRKKKVVEVNGRNWSDSPEQRSTRYQAKRLVEDNLSVESPQEKLVRDKVVAKGKDSPLKKKKSAQIKSESSPVLAEAAESPGSPGKTVGKGSVRFTRSGNGNGAKIKVSSKVDSISSESEDDFFDPKPKEILKKKLLAKVTGKDSSIKSPNKKVTVLDCGTPKIKEVPQNSRSPKSTPKKGKQNVPIESSRTPSPCFHIWPPRNL